MFSDAASRRAAGRGFTLIELTITVAVVALLAAVAYPSYQNSVLKSRRAEAKAALADAAQRLERYYTENNRYTGAAFCTVGSAGCTAANRVYDPRSENGYYALVPTLNATTFFVDAVPQGTQANDACGTLRLDQANVRSVTGGTETDSTKCW